LKVVSSHIRHIHGEKDAKQEGKHRRCVLVFILLSGAIGVSGSTVEEDLACAQVAVDAIA